MSGPTEPFQQQLRHASQMSNLSRIETGCFPERELGQEYGQAFSQSPKSTYIGNAPQRQQFAYPFGPYFVEPWLSLEAQQLSASRHVSHGLQQSMYQPSMTTAPYHNNLFPAVPLSSQHISPYQQISHDFEEAMLARRLDHQYHRYCSTAPLSASDHVIPVFRGPVGPKRLNYHLDVESSYGSSLSRARPQYVPDLVKAPDIVRVERRTGVLSNANISLEDSQSTGVRGTRREKFEGRIEPKMSITLPKRPKQSGHALWVGNLPSDTKVAELKDHFSKEATQDIESVFLISKSNCAFVNYRHDEACDAAMSRFHGSMFNGAKLVCRLRVATKVDSRGPLLSPAATQVRESGELEDGQFSANEQTLSSTRVLEKQENPSPRIKVKAKYFIVKSFTVEDLELSVRKGIWRTQARNEATLTEAYKNTENVYLIFSANKSGGYFGFARMESPVGDEFALLVDTSPQPSRTTPLEPTLPSVTPTSPTDSAPGGRIVEDKVKGTVFWEADDVAEDSGEDSPCLGAEGGNPDNDHGGNLIVNGTASTAGFSCGSGFGSRSGSESSPASTDQSQSFGKPFRVQWLSTDKLPFYWTRGLTNPWNGNREVKIARDGTELEPSVGQRLIAMFYQPQIGFGAPLMSMRL